MTKTFRGVVFHGVRDVRVEDRPFPTAETIADTDAVVRVTSAGINPLSASFTNRKDSVEAIFTVSVWAREMANMVAYRGHESRWRTGFIIGHEFVGKIVMVGVKVKDFKPGDHIVSPFTR
jgi:threonine dehydrogenase-like Zn-dependent dehydrogenase